MIRCVHEKKHMLDPTMTFATLQFREASAWRSAASPGSSCGASWAAWLDVVRTRAWGPCGQRQGQVAEDKVEVAWFERASSAMEGPRRSLQVVAKILQLDDVLPRLAHYRVESSGL